MIFGVGAQSEKSFVKKTTVPSCNLIARRRAKQINETANEARINRRMRRSSKNQKAQAEKIGKERSKMPKDTEDEENYVM